jgi:P4 family phage/plasmid primase-like protien
VVAQDQFYKRAEHPAPAGDVEDALRLWRHLFAPQRGYLCACTAQRHGDELEDIHHEFFRYPEQAQEAAQHLMNASKRGREAYFGVHLFVEPSTRQKHNAAPSRDLWVDLDGASIPEQPKLTAVVESSPGHFHGYIRLSRALDPHEAEALNKRLTYAIGADKGKWALATVLRPPGTINHKREVPWTVRLVELDGSAEHDPEELEAILPPTTAVSAGSRSTGQQRSRNGAFWTAELLGEPPVELNASDREAWTGERFATREDGSLDRSDTLFWIGCGVARGLKGTSLSKDAKAAVIEGAVAERDRALGYLKYAGRGDESEQYRNIAFRAVDEVAGGERVAPSEPTFHTNGKGRSAESAEDATYPKPPRDNDSSNQGPTKRLADAILEDEHFAQDAGGKLYRFSGGAYRKHAERYVRRRVKELLEEWEESAKWSSHRANEVIEYIRADCPELWERPPMDEVNVLNGILNVVTRERRDHVPEFLSPVQIPVRYDPEAACPEWEKFVSEVFPEDAQDLAFELAADLMTPSRSAQKALLFLGEGSNGKSTALRALTAFIGSTNAAGVSLHRLESDRFATARLVGKLANICPDLPSTHLAETSIFKAITGGDRLGAEYKYREAFEFAPYCRLVFSANHVPRSGDASHAFFRRWLVIPFERIFEPDEQIPREELDAKLSEPTELSGVLNRALDALARVRREGFTESKSMREAWEEFRAMTDPVSVWLANNTVESAEAFVPKDALAKAYNEFCDKVGRPGMNKKGFGRAVKRTFPHIEEGQKSVAGKMTWCWLGIGLKSGGTDPTTPSTNATNETNENSATCFENRGELQEGDKEGAEKTNIENSVSSVSSVTTEEPGPKKKEPWEESIDRLKEQGRL